MKSLLYFIFASVLLLSSCSKTIDALESKDFSINNYPQTWKLIKMTGSQEGSESSGEEMEWQENYVFNSDGSFVKTRISTGELKSASGRYFFNEEIQSFILDYGKSNPIIGSCGSAVEESLYYTKDSKILQSNWWACDGPGLFYKRIK